MTFQASINVNGRSYFWPKRPAVVICLDGCEPAYLDSAISDGLMPNLERIKSYGSDCLAKSVIPSFTNPNNVSIATGRPPNVHGICNNYFFDPEKGDEVMMNDARFMRASTIFEKFFLAGGNVAVVTAKDKLRALLGSGLTFDNDRAVCFSAEKSSLTTKAEHGIDRASEWLERSQPEVYSAELSEFVFAAGVKLLKERHPDIMYLTTTDFVQHKYAPETSEAKSFYAMFDSYLGQLDALNAAIVITADHGMKPKHRENGSPVVIYLQDILDSRVGEDNTRVILPITDPYVEHHGALGSFACVYQSGGISLQKVAAFLSDIEGITHVLGREEAADRFELPADRIGDLVLISAENVCLGTSEHDHDLSRLKVPLRSHGGVTEQIVPFIMNIPSKHKCNKFLRNFDAFFYLLSSIA